MTLKTALLVLIAGLALAFIGLGITVAKANGYILQPDSSESAALKKAHTRYRTQLDANAPAVDLCVSAGIAAEVALQSEDKSDYTYWLNVRSVDCKKAGIRIR